MKWEEKEKENEKEKEKEKGRERKTRKSSAAPRKVFFLSPAPRR